MRITESSRVPDSTYFRTGDAEPRIKDSELVLLDGQGTRRSSWGAPGITSTVVVERDDFVAIHIGFYHKHGGGQFWRYYRQDGQITCVGWKSLSEEERLEVLDAWIERAPNWAKRPGKLRRDYIRRGELSLTEQLADGRFVGYKCLGRTDDGMFFSPIAFSKPRWEGDQLEADQVPDAANTNGIYATKSRKDPALPIRDGRVLVKVALSGTVVEHERGFRAECAEILEVLS